MATKILNHLDFNKVAQLKNVLAEIIAGAASSPVEGQYWYNSSIQHLQFASSGGTARTIADDTTALSGDITGTFGATAIGSGVIVNADVNASAAIAYSKLNLATSIVNADISASAAIVYSKLSLGNSIVNADISSSAAIAYSKLNLATSIVNADVSASAAIAYSKLNLSASIVNADIASGAAIAYSKIAAPTSTVSMGSQVVSNVATPVSGTDATNKNYVDAAVSGISWRPAVRAATTANITLSGAQTIDGISVVAGNRVLVKNQTSTQFNGVYVAAAGAWSRATDFDVAAEIYGSAVFVEEGTVNGSTGWIVTEPDSADSFTINTDPITFTQFAGPGTYVAGGGIGLSGTTFSVAAGSGLDQDADGLSIETPNLPLYLDPDKLSLHYSSGLGLSGSDLVVDLAYLYAQGITRKFSVNNSSGTTTTVTHNLGTRDCIVQIYDLSTYETVEADVVRTSTNVVTVTFAASQTVNTLRIVVTA